jgi:enamine deaminase RidA (YjgF/YER057c/UK114 family)
VSSQSNVLRYGAEELYSMATVHNGVAYIAGQVASDTSADIRGQTASALAALDAQLSAVGASRSSLLNVTIWLASRDDYDGMNEVWTEWVPEGSPPPRATAIVGLADPQYLIEILSTAAIDN